MSLMYTTLLKNKELIKELRKKFPGVLIESFSSFDSSLTIEEKEQLIGSEYEDFPNKLKNIYDMLKANCELSMLVQRNLDRLYSLEEATYYSENRIEFINSFAFFNDEVHSAEYIVSFLESNNFLLRYAGVSENQTIIYCDEKKLDTSDKFNPEICFQEKKICLIPEGDHETFTEVLNRKISQIQDTIERRCIV